MTRNTVIINFITKTVIPILFAVFMYQMFVGYCTNNGIVNYVYLLMICGIPFGIKFMFLLPTFFGNIGLSIFAICLNVIIGSVIGGFILIWKLAVALYYIPLSIVRFARA